MNNDEFINEYNNIVERASIISEKARHEGLLVTEEMIDENKYLNRDIFEYGLRLIVDGLDAEMVDKLLINVIELEDDKNKKLLKIIQKEAILAIQAGWNPRLLMLLLNSYVNINVEETMRNYNEM
jgi:flagellar motor component MotA